MEPEEVIEESEEPRDEPEAGSTEREGPVGSVVVVGGGIAGMQASLDLADTGILVHLVEEKPGIGGWMSKLDKTFPTNDCAMCTLAPKLVGVGRHPNIRMMTNAHVTGFEGDVGDFDVTVEWRPRYIDADVCTGCGLCAQWCPIEAISSYDEGVGDQAAVSVLYPQTVPLVYVIDRDRCIGCGLCAEVCAANAVDYTQKPYEERFKVGSAILAAGYEDIPGQVRPEYGLGRYPNVVTAPQFERILSASGPYAGEVLRPSDGKHPKKIAWLQCVGSRDVHRGRSYCSSVCCTYATKEAVIAKEHLGVDGVDCQIFFMDMRTFGKGFEEYYNRARNEYGVKYNRCRLGEVREDPKTHDLILRYESEDGEDLEETFELVVLSTGLEPPPTAQELGDIFGVELDEDGFVVTKIFSPVSSSRPGVFVCGVLQGTKDIPDTVAQASAAAANAEAIVSGSRWSEITPIELPEERDISQEEVRIGVFVCHCGINIAGVVDVRDVAKFALTLPGVVHAEHNLYTCSQDTQDSIKERMKELGLNRVIVASCTPRTHEPLFQDTVREAGLNPWLFELTSIREHASWVHKYEPEAATLKSKHLVAMAVDKVRRALPVTKEPMGVEHVGLIIGGGPAGMTAALALEAQGLRAVLVEREDRLGGNLHRLPHLLEDEDPVMELNSMIDQVHAKEDIEVLLSSEMIDLGGFVGNFTATVNTPNGDRSMQVGAIIVATGAQEWDPTMTPLLYGKDPRVLTVLEAGEALEKGDFPLEGPVVFVHCVGSRLPDFREYCSRVCCATSIKNAIAIKEKSPDTEVIMLYRDIRTYGKRELAYGKAREMGVLFARYSLEDPLTLTNEGDDLILEYLDIIARKRVRRRMGAAVLATAAIPPEGSEELGRILKVPLTEHGFFLEAHMKIRPLDFATDGVFLAGACHGPKFLDEAISQALGAASRAATILANDKVQTEGLPAWVDEERCSGCGICEE
ncbi:MAG: FAD-dependent oxidoreductase, partial [Candidatus Thermoplasmatota archaeon]|nr:FAD-dependent oxidoreductase [Candidatus Thermoplasmatota archaeon]